MIVASADELRDSLSTSGVFDMTDCKVYIDCPLDGTADDVQKMIAILEATINVVDVKVAGVAANDGLEYVIEITEVPIETIEGKTPKKYRN